MRVFLLPASKKNIDASIVGAVGLEVAASHMRADELQELQRCLGERRAFNCWAFAGRGKVFYDQMQPGDIALFALKGTKRFGYVAEALHKCIVPKMGERIWGYCPGEPWEMVFFLTNVRAVDIDKRQCLTECGYKPKFELPGGMSRTCSPKVDPSGDTSPLLA